MKKFLLEFVNWFVTAENIEKYKLHTLTAENLEKWKTPNTAENLQKFKNKTPKSALPPKIPLLSMTHAENL